MVCFILVCFILKLRLSYQLVSKIRRSPSAWLLFKVFDSSLLPMLTCRWCSLDVIAVIFGQFDSKPRGHGPGAVHVLHSFFLFFIFVGYQTKTSALPNFEWRNVWCLFAKSCWNINTWTMLRMLFSLLCVKYIFFWFYRSVGFEENNKYAKNAKKRVLRQP